MPFSLVSSSESLALLVNGEPNCSWIYGSNLKLRRNNLNSPEDLAASFSCTYIPLSQIVLYFHILMLIQILSQRVWKTTSLNLMYWRQRKSPTDTTSWIHFWESPQHQRQYWVLHSRPEKVWRKTLLLEMFYSNITSEVFVSSKIGQHPKTNFVQDNDVSQIIPAFLMNWILFLLLARTF